MDEDEQTTILEQWACMGSWIVLRTPPGACSAYESSSINHKYGILGPNIAGLIVRVVHPALPT